MVRWNVGAQAGCFIAAYKRRRVMRARPCSGGRDPVAWVQMQLTRRLDILRNVFKTSEPPLIGNGLPHPRSQSLGSGPREVGYIRIGCLTTSNMHISPVTLMSLHPRGRPHISPACARAALRQSATAPEPSSVGEVVLAEAQSLDNLQRRRTYLDLGPLHSHHWPAATGHLRPQVVKHASGPEHVHGLLQRQGLFPDAAVLHLPLEVHPAHLVRQNPVLRFTVHEDGALEPQPQLDLHFELSHGHGLIEVHLVSFSRGGPRADATRLPCPSLPDAVPGHRKRQLRNASASSFWRDPSSQKASAALCKAVLALASTDTMPSKRTWPVPWAPADKHMLMPLVASQQKKKTG